MCIIGKALKVIDVPESRPIKAYRAWGYGKDASLVSVRGNYRWLEGGKINKSDQKPLLNGIHGFWAFKTSEERRREFPNFWGGATGTVLLFGKVAVHETGYRAQYAKIKRVYRGRRH